MASNAPKTKRDEGGQPSKSGKDKKTPAPSSKPTPPKGKK